MRLVRRARLAFLIAAAVLIAAAIAGAAIFAREDDDAPDETIELTPSRSGVSSFGIARSSTPQPLARLPGITVLGTGNVRAAPDTAIVRLQVGSGPRFGSPDQEIALVDEDDLEPVVDALADAGTPREAIDVNAFGGESYGNDGAAQIVARSPRPGNVRALLAAAQSALRKETDYNLQDVAVAFVLERCEDAEARATSEALADARERAERLARLAGAKLGRVIAVSESPGGTAFAPYFVSTCGDPEATVTPLFEFQAASGNAEEITIRTTLEVTFAVGAG